MSYPYQDPALPIDERVEDLLGRMTTLEKVRQLNCTMAFGGAAIDPEKLDLADGMGEMAVMGAQPADAAASIKAVQDYMRQHTRLGIPVLFHCEALSGPVLPGAQVFPTSISLGATFDPALVKDMCARTRRQMTAVGVRQALSPVLDVARDLRWGRVSETYGGDPTLCAAMGSAFVEGLQGPDLKDGVAATLKHFLGYSSTQGGLNMARTNTDDRELRETFAKPFEAAIRKAGVKSVMNSYAEYNGKPICASKEVLTDLLRDDLGFTGLVVSDYMSVNRLVKTFHTAATATEAGEQCLAAGLDVECPNPYGYNAELAADADAGKFDMAHIDRSVRRVLRLKFELGLFENPDPRFDRLAAAMNNTENDKKSREAAMKVMTLTKNEGILPITDRSKKIAVIGPLGHAPRAHYACYTVPGSVEMALSGAGGMAGVESDGEGPGGGLLGAGNPLAAREMPFHAADEILRQMYPDLRTTYEALQEEFDSVTYVEGCDYVDPEKTDFDAAVQAARDADIVVMAVGGRNGWGMYNTSGEGADRSDFGLPGVQEALLKTVYAANPNMVVVHTDAKPLVSEWTYEHAPAILEGWLACTYGGVAIAKTLTGENDPGGRMQMDVPRQSSHGPIGHYFHNGTGYRSFEAGAVNPDGYLDISNRPRLPFGYGLSYTAFTYSDCSVTLDGAYNVTAKAAVTNTGSVPGDEVVQLYAADRLASIIRPEQELAGFQRITLAPGETRTVAFTFNLDQLAFCNDSGDWVVEAGDFEISFGKNSGEKLFSETVTAPETRVIDHTKRGFFAEAHVI